MQSPYLLSLMPVLILGLSATMISAAAAPPGYAGNSKCRVCHLPQYKSWQQTKMARAYELLKPGKAAVEKKKAKLDPQKDYTQDSSCLACHTTGYGQPGGFRDITTTPDLGGVGCEACHGPGSDYLRPTHMSLQNKEYKRAELIAAGLVIPDKQTCTVCHNEKSPFVQTTAHFDFAKMKSQGTHEHSPLKYKH